MNQLETVTNWFGQTATYNYDDAGRLSSLLNFNGTIITCEYDNASRMTALSNERSNKTVIASFSFTLDANGNRTNITEEIPLAAIPTALSIIYDYNPEKNRLLSAGSTNFGHDLEGQLSAKGTTTFDFDFAHRLETITGSTPTYFTYDGANRRLSATRNGVETRYIYDPSGNLIAMADENNTILGYFVYGKGLMAMINPSNQVFCYHFDGTGNTIALTDNSQNVINQYSYTPFGMIMEEQETIPQPFKYVGQCGVMAEVDGLYYMRARYYDADTGRFISEDPIGFKGGDVNLYGYASNNPIMRIDPNGLRDFFLFGEADSVPFLGSEYGIGIVIDTDNFMDSGIFTTGGPAVGGNLGLGVGVGYAARELEGTSWNIDANLGPLSPTISFDDQGYNGFSLSGGLGGGVSLSGTITNTYSLNNLVQAWKGNGHTVNQSKQSNCNR